MHLHTYTHRSVITLCQLTDQVIDTDYLYKYCRSFCWRIWTSQLLQWSLPFRIFFTPSSFHLLNICVKFYSDYWTLRKLPSRKWDRWRKTNSSYKDAIKLNHLTSIISAWFHLVLLVSSSSRLTMLTMLTSFYSSTRRRKQGSLVSYIQRTFYLIHFLKTFSLFLMRWTSKSLPVRVWEHHGRETYRGEVKSYRRLTLRRSVNLLKPVAWFPPGSFLCHFTCWEWNFIEHTVKEQWQKSGLTPRQEKSVNMEKYKIVYINTAWRWRKNTKI